MANTIHLRGDRTHYDEGYAEAAIMPGMILDVAGVDADGRPEVKPHGTAAGPTECAVAWEDGLRGMTCRGEVQDTSNLGYQIADLVRYKRYAPGQAAQLLLQDEQNIALDDWLCSAGDGTVKKTTDPEGENGFARAEQALNLTGAAGNALIEARFARAV